MKKAVLKESKKVEVEDVSEPELPDSSWVKVKVKACGVCGSDVEPWKWGPAEDVTDERITQLIQDYETVAGVPWSEDLFGHEYSGEIVEVGSDVEEFEVGDRVAVQAPGGYASYAVAPAGDAGVLQKMPEELSYEEGAMIEPSITGVAGVRKSKIKLGDTAVVLGAGPIGLITMQCAKAAGASEVYQTEVKEERIKLAEELGATEVINPAEEDLVERITELTDGRMPDVVFECTGVTEVLQDSIDLARIVGAGGHPGYEKHTRIVVIGVYGHEAEISPNWIPWKNVEILGQHGSEGTGKHEANIALELARQGRLKFEPMVEHFPLEGIQSAFEAAANGQVNKSMITPP